MSKFILNAFSDEAGKPLKEQIKALKDNVYHGMEIRGIDNAFVGALTVERAKEIKKEMDDAGLKVWSIGSAIGKIRIQDDFEAHMDLYKHSLELAAIFDAKAFRLFSFFMPKEEDPYQYENQVIEQMARFCEVGKDYNITLCHENEKGIFGDVADRCLKIHKALPELKGVFDPANFVQCQQDTLEAWEMLHPYIEYMHMKDALMDGTVVPVGYGAGNVGTLIKKYYAGGGRVLTLEPHLRVFAGMQELEKDFEEKNIGSMSYPSARAAFDAAVSALNKLIEEV